MLTVSAPSKDGKAVTTIVVDKDKIQKIIDQLSKNSVIQIYIDKASDGLNVQIDGKILESLISKNCTIEVKSSDATYNMYIFSSRTQNTV